MDEQKVIDLFEKRLKENIEKNKYGYVQEVATWISKVFLEETKTEVTHDDDPYWDNSGKAVVTNEFFDSEDYTDLDSFTEHEYNGQSSPSFESGCGLYHDRYYKEVDELTDDFVSLQLEFVVDDLLKEKNALLIEYTKEKEEEEEDNENYKTAEEVTSLLLIEDILGDFVVCYYPIDLKEYVGKLDLKTLLKLGDKKAKEKIKQEQIDYEKRAKEQLEKEKKAEAFWNKLVSFHKLRNQKDMPNKVEKGYYKEFIEPILKGVLKDGEPLENIHCLGEVYSFKFSHTVVFELKNYKKERDF